MRARLISTWTFLNTWGHFKCSDLCSVIHCESVTEPGLSARYQQPLNHWLQPSDHTTSPLASSPLLPLYHPGVSLGLVWLKYTHGMSNWSHPGLPGAMARGTYRVAQVEKLKCPVTVYAVLDAWHKYNDIARGGWIEQRWIALLRTGNWSVICLK